MSNERNVHAASAPTDDSEAVIRELRIRVGLLQSELEQLRREHATLKASLAQDVAALARRYLEPQKHGPVRHVDGVIFGGWDRPDAGDRAGISDVDDDRDSKSA